MVRGATAGTSLTECKSRSTCSAPEWRANRGRTSSGALEAILFSRTWRARDESISRDSSGSGVLTRFLRNMDDLERMASGYQPDHQYQLALMNHLQVEEEWELVEPDSR